MTSIELAGTFLKTIRSEQGSHTAGYGLLIGILALLLDTVVPWFLKSYLVLIYIAQCCLRFRRWRSSAIYLVCTATFFWITSSVGGAGMVRFHIAFNSLLVLSLKIVYRTFVEQHAVAEVLQAELPKSGEWAMLVIVILWSLNGIIATISALFLLTWLLPQGKLRELAYESRLHVQAWWLQILRALEEDHLAGRSGHGLSELFLPSSEPLKPGEIRLVRLRHRKPFQSIECSMVRVTLEKAPYYSAASYSWLDQRRTERLYVRNENGEERKTTVTKSALEVLHREQSFFWNTYVWIDILCINHSNLVEKTRQVMMMPKIYTNAAKVNAYLDSSLTNRYPLSSGSPMLADGGVQGAHQQSALTYRRQFSNFDSPWISRSSIIQEAVLARNLRFVNGSMTVNSLSWDYAMKGLETFNPASHSKLDGVLDIQNARYLSEDFVRGVRLYRLKQEVKKRSKLPLDILLSRFADFRTSEPRDKIYALLSLANHEDIVTVPLHYARPAAEVFTEFMHSMACLRDNLDVLAYAGLCQPDRPDGLPSWVSPWTALNPLFDLGEEPLFYAGSSSGWYPGEQGDDHSVLRVPAKQVDKIKKVGEIFEIALSDRVTKRKAIDIPTHYVLRQAWGLALSECRKHYDNDNEMAQAFWELLAMNSLRRVPEPNEAELPDLVARFDRYYNIRGNFTYSPYLQVDALSADDQVDFQRLRSQIHQVIRRLSFTLLGNRFGVTEAGRMGIFPPVARPGDTVQLIASAQVPFVLRPGAAPSDDLPEFQLVGACQLLGAMEGELNDDTWESCLLV